VNRRFAARASALAVMAIAIVLAAVIVVTGSGPRRGVAVQYGANVNWLFNSPYTDTEISAQLSALRATGATLARSDALWEASEPAPPLAGVHHFDWGFDDRVASMLAQHGLRWLPIIDYTVAWAESTPGNDHSPPRSFADYAAYAGAFAARYGPGGIFWRSHPELPQLPVQLYEIWNEPDNPEFWFPHPSPAAYAQLYAAAHASILAADPRARVLVGGLTDPSWFVSAILAAIPALRGQIGGVAIHPYGATPAAVIAKVQAARAVLDSDGLGSVGLYVTEFGWTTEPAGALQWAPPSVRPGYIEDTLTTLAGTGCGIDAVTMYTWTTPDQEPRNPQQWFGISPPGAGGGADVRAFAIGLAAARGASVTGSC
jgi:hypothetical protein